jgi:hypothetical protein
VSGDNTISRTKRSTQSLRFERALRSKVPGVMPRLSDIDYGPIRDLVPWVAVLDPDRATLCLRFTRAGAGVEKLVGREAVGFDYLELVDPAIKGDAFDSAFVMLSRPCGLWQITPGQLADGSRVKVEYTGFPVFDEQRGRGQLIVLITHAIADVGKVPAIRTVQHSTEWHWIKLRNA